MISEYLDKEVLVAQLRKELDRDAVYDFNQIISTGKRLGDYIAYHVPQEGVWLLTHYWTGIVFDVYFGENIDKYGGMYEY